MRKFKAVIIDFKKVALRTTSLLLAGVTAVLALYTESKELFEGSCEKILARSIPVYITNGENAWSMNKTFERLARVFIGFNPQNSNSVITGTIPVYAAVKNSGLLTISGYENAVVTKAEVGSENTQKYEIPEENRARIKEINAAQRKSEYGIAIGNETSYGIDIAAMLSSKPRLSSIGNDVKILITHTHATEGYSTTGDEFYDVTASDRTQNIKENVVAVGERMAEVFETNGIKTIHDTELHDVPSFNGSYAHSLSAVQEYIKKYPTIEIVFDIHRDSIVYDDKTKAKTVTEIDGKKAAQLMLVVGTDENGLYHPNWRENVKSAIHFQNEICKKYPTLMRHINLRKERFNGHTTAASMIIEVGTSGNTLPEALNGIEFAAESIAQYLKSL